MLNFVKKLGGVIIMQQQQVVNPIIRNRRGRTAAILLAFFFGGIGAEWFYLGCAGRGILSLPFCWTFIPAFIAVIHIISLLCMSSDHFDRKYNM